MHKLHRRKGHATVAARLVHLFQLIRNLLRLPRDACVPAGSAPEYVSRTRAQMLKSEGRNFPIVGALRSARKASHFQFGKDKSLSGPSLALQY